MVPGGGGGGQGEYRLAHGLLEATQMLQQQTTQGTEHTRRHELSADHVNNEGRGRRQPCEPERRDPAHLGGHITASQGSGNSSVVRASDS